MSEHKGREQGAELGNEVVYVRTEDGDDRERRAYTPADHVNLQARGWVRRDSKSKAPKPASRKGGPTSGGGAGSDAAPAASS